MDNFITPEEAAEQIKVTAATVKTWIRNGELKAQKFGKQWRIKVNDWNEYINGEVSLDEENEQAMIKAIEKAVNQSVIEKRNINLCNNVKRIGSMMYLTKDYSFFYDGEKLYQLGKEIKVSDE